MAPVRLDLASHATQREFISAGAAAGLAAAFGAPIGGVLFSLEEASSFWSRKVMWRSFICAAAASIMLAILNNRGNAGMVFFGGVRPTTPRDYLHQLPFFVITAAAAGVTGAVFNQAQTWLSYVRPASRRTFARLLECALVSIGTVALRFAASHLAGTCVVQPAAWGEDDFGVRFLCPEGYINDVATTFFSSPDKTIGWMLSMGEHSWGQPYGFTPSGLAVCSGLYLVMMIFAFGTAVPGGIFMPSIFLGACGGGCLGLMFRLALPDAWDIQPGVYALIGATAMLGGVFRSSISLVVIMAGRRAVCLFSTLATITPCPPRRRPPKAPVPMQPNTRLPVSRPQGLEVPTPCEPHRARGRRNYVSHLCACSPQDAMRAISGPAVRWKARAAFPLCLASSSRWWCQTRSAAGSPTMACTT
jgi:chloride channel 7